MADRMSPGVPEALVQRALHGERITVTKDELDQMLAAATPAEATALRQRVRSNDVYVEDR